MSRYKLHGVFCALLYFKCTKDKGDTESKDCRFHRHGSVCCYFILFYFVMNLLLALHSPCYLRHLLVC